MNILRRGRRQSLVPGIVCAALAAGLSAAGVFVPVGPEFQVTDLPGTTSDQPSVGMRADGSFVVVWRQPDGVTGRRFGSNGTPLGSSFPVHSNAMGSVAMGQAGDFVVSLWQFQSYGEPTSIKARRYDAAGQSLGPDTVVSTNADGYVPVVAKRPDRSFVVAWASDPLRSSERLVGLDGVPLTPESHLVTPTMTQRELSIAADQAGNFMVGTASVGEDIEYSAFANFFDRNGLHARTTWLRLAPSYSYYPVFSMSGPGDFIAAWTAFLDPPVDYNYHVKAQTYRAGVPTGTPFRVDTSAGATLGGDTTSPVGASQRNGGFIVVWSVELPSSIWAIRGRSLLPDGSPEGVEIDVSSMAAVQALPSVASDGVDRLVVAWERRNFGSSDYRVFARRFCRLGGEPRGGEKRVDLGAPAVRGRPSTTAAGPGFLIVWESDLQDGSSTGVYGRRLDEEGAPLGSEFRVNTTTAGSQSRPSAASAGRSSWCGEATVRTARAAASSGAGSTPRGRPRGPRSRSTATRRASRAPRPWRWTTTAASPSSGRARARTDPGPASLRAASTPGALPWDRRSQSTPRPAETRTRPRSHRTATRARSSSPGAPPDRTARDREFSRGSTRAVLRRAGRSP